jgi:hypothetical protein
LAFFFAFFFWFFVRPVEPDAACPLLPPLRPAAVAAAVAAAGGGLLAGCSCISQWRGDSVSSSITFSGLKSVWMICSFLQQPRSSHANEKM